MNPESHIRGYLTHAVLPPILFSPDAPQPPSSDATPVFMEIASWPFSKHKLSKMWRLHKSDLDLFVTQFSLVLPSSPVAISVNDFGTTTINVDARPHFDIGSRPLALKAVSLAEGVAHWVEYYALDTVERLIHLADPRWSNRHFVRQSMEGRVFDGRSGFFWREARADGGKNWMYVAVLPPWALPPRDFERLTSMTKLPSYGSLDPVQRLWTEIYNECVKAKCHLFIVTTYEQWAFGSFTGGYSSAGITEMLPFNSVAPTMLQIILYWSVVCQEEGVWPVCTTKFPEDSTPALPTDRPLTRDVSMGLAQGSFMRED